MPRPLVVDSGAAETVLPATWSTEHELRENDDSRSGQYYITADGTHIDAMGEKTLTLSTLDWGSTRDMTFQVTGVNKALGSVSKMVKNGNKIVFDAAGSYVENIVTKERLWLREDNGVYVLDVLVAPPGWTNDEESSQSGFTRQGR